MDVNISGIHLWFNSLVLLGSDPNKDGDDAISLALFSLWFIWKTRNSKILEERNPSLMETLYAIKAMALEFRSCMKNDNHPLEELPPAVKYSSGWRLLRLNIITVNSDAQFDLGS